MSYVLALLATFILACPVYAQAGNLAVRLSPFRSVWAWRFRLLDQFDQIGQSKTRSAVRRYH
jgi:hypothetical protein